MTMTLKDYIKPLNVGSVRLEGNIFNAPCSGFSDWPERLLFKQMGAFLCVTEFVNIEGIMRADRRSLEMLSFKDAEQPVSAQIYGDEPEHVPPAAEIVEEMGYAILDINMGCPSKKVCKHGAGSALLASPDRAVEMVRQAVKTVKIPVTVKMRTGFRDDNRNAIEVAQRLVDEGAKMIVVTAEPPNKPTKGKLTGSSSPVSKMHYAIKSRSSPTATLSVRRARKNVFR
jgi:tRNA-dihydrouridine synthase B